MTSLLRFSISGFLSLAILVLTTNTNVSADQTFSNLDKELNKYNNEKSSPAKTESTKSDKIIEQDSSPNSKQNKQANIRSLDEPTETMVVTAQKRKQSIHVVPLPISAFTEDSLTRAQVSDISELQAITPSLSIGQFNLGQPQIYIRGIGSNEDGAGGDSSVAIFIDGVFISRPSATMFKFLDVERIEVLRGPQGTLYGKNVIGGAINIITHQAEHRQTSQIKAQVGSDNYSQFNGLYSASLDGDSNWFTKVALLKSQQDGYIHSRNGFDLNDANDEGLRAQLAYVSDDNWQWHLSYDWSTQTQSGAGRHPVGGALGNDILPAIDPNAASDPFTSFADIEGYQKKRLVGWQHQLDWTWRESNFKWLSAKRKHHFKFLNDDLAISPDEYFLDITNLASESSIQVSHELTWQTTTDSGANWILGIYSLEEEVERTESFAANIIATGTSHQFNKLTSRAVFGHLVYPLSDTQKLTIGARQTWEQKSIAQQGIAGFIISESYQVSDKESWQHFTPQIAWSNQLDPQSMFYINLSKGFKSGGYQGQAPTAIAAQTPFNEEIADNLDIGIKITGEHYKDFLHANIFYTNYKDLQILELFQQDDDPVGVLITQNAAEAVSKGFELEYQHHWLLDSIIAQSLTFRGNYTYLDATYKDFYLQQDDSRVGNQLRNAPKHAIGLSLHGITEINNHAEVSWQYTHSYQQQRFQEPVNIDDASIPAYDLANFWIQYQLNQSKWAASLWIKNLYDEVYYLHNFPIGNITNPSTPARGRTLGIELTYQF
jgi:iron complex outermembrane recepter protein